MIIKNGTVFNDNFKFVKADVLVEDGKIKAVAPCGELAGEGEVIDAEGKYVVPGFVDVHVHGAAGADFSDGAAGDIEKMAAYEGSVGVTSFCGTTMAFSEEILNGIFDAAKQVRGNRKQGSANLIGINMEGPFFNKAKKGAQAEKYIIDPDMPMFRRLYERSGRMILLVDIAPELSGSVDFIKEASRECAVSVAHTCATYQEAKAAFEAGANHVTHLYNAMPPFTHRDPGVVGAACDYADYVELICDGIHIHPSVVRSVFKMFGEDRVCLISDSMRAAGMPNGVYSLGGQTVYMTDGKATLEDGTIAGSATCLPECFRRAVKFGIPLESALRAATANPAKSVGKYDEIGSLTAGKRADIVILDESLQPVSIIMEGKVQ